MSLKPQLWEGRGQAPDDQALTRDAAPRSANRDSVKATGDAEAPVCFTVQSLCRHLSISTRSWTRAAALGLTPRPDLVVGRSARWSPSTIDRWLKSQPKLPGRGGRDVK
jgi:hypothetical protein